jgi:hypothetical protein
VKKNRKQVDFWDIFRLNSSYLLMLRVAAKYWKNVVLMCIVSGSKQNFQF